MDIEKFMLKFLKDNNFEINKDKSFKYLVYDNSDKLLSMENIYKVLNSKNPEDELYEIIVDFYNDYEQIDNIIYLIKYTYPDIYKNFNEAIKEWIIEHINIEYPIKKFLNYEYLVNIVIDTGNSNFDYTLNCIPQHNKGIKNEASIVWLAKVNGYSKKQLENAIKNKEFNESIFLKSVFEELSNCSTHMNALIFFTQMTLKELIDIQNYKDFTYIKINRNTNAGLCDLWSGARGLLEICLEKDIIIPAKYISSCLPDGMHGYSIKDIYGINNNLWEYGGDIEIKRKDGGHLL